MKIVRTVQLAVPVGKVGRNDPCPCRSGRKYKKCHLLKPVKEEPSSPEEKTGWIARLVDWSTKQPWYSNTFKQTIEAVFGKDKKEMNEQEVQSLSETILFELKVKDEKTPLKLFVEQASISNTQREVYRSWLAKGIFGAFEVTEVFLGIGMRVKRFGREESLLISEHMGSYSIKVGDVLVSRALPFPNGWMFGGGVSAFMPESWVYEFRRHKVPFNISALEFLKLWYGKKQKKPQHYKSYEQLKEELFKLIIKEEMQFDTSEFDEKIKRATNPSVFFYPLYKATYGYEELAEKIMNLTFDLWKTVHYKPDYFEEDIPMGEIETALVHDFTQYCGKQFEKEDIIDPTVQLRLSDVWREEWLNKPQKALKWHTPKEAILAERKDRGEKKTTFDFNTTVYFAPKQWDKADILHEKGLSAFRKNDFQKARQYFREIMNHYPDFPFIFRSIANLGMCYIALGDKREGLRLLKQARDMNPNYRFARQHYERIQKIPSQRIKDNAGAARMEEAVKKLLDMVHRVKQRRRSKGIWIKKSRK